MGEAVKTWLTINEEGARGGHDENFHVIVDVPMMVVPWLWPNGK